MPMGKRVKDRGLRPSAAVIPNDNGAGPNEPPISVGPTSSTNAPGNFVMTPTPAVLSASRWSGWPTDWTPPPMEPLGGGGEWGGFGFGREGYGGYLANVSTVMTCVDRNNVLASFPAYGLKGRYPRDLPSWYQVSPEPELYSDWHAFMVAALTSFQLYGEAILWATARFADGFPARFVVLDPRSVRFDDGEYYLGGEKLVRRDVCQINYLQQPGALRNGIGPLRWAYGNLVSAGTLAKYADAVARYGVWAVLRHPGELTADQAAELQGQWMTARYANAGAPAVLSGGLEFEALTMSPEDMALLGLMTFNLQMIAAAFRLPAYLINLDQPGGFTYSNAEGLYMAHWRTGLLRIADQFSRALSNWLLPAGTVIEFDPDRYVQPSIEQRATAYATLHGIVEPDGRRAMTVDEIRAKERWEPYPDNDEALSLTGGAP